MMLEQIDSVITNMLLESGSKACGSGGIASMAIIVSSVGVDVERKSVQKTKRVLGRRRFLLPCSHARKKLIGQRNQATSMPHAFVANRPQQKKQAHLQG